MEAVTLLIIDDEKNIREGLKKALTLQGYNVLAASDAKEGMKQFLMNRIALVILDIKMPGLSGMDMLGQIKEVDTTVPVIFLTGHGSVETAVEAMQQGAYDFLTKPVNLDRLEVIIKRALNLKQLTVSNRSLTVRLKEYEIEKTLLGVSKATQKLHETIKHIAPSKANIFIYGESGTGKEEVCNAIHALCHPDKPLIKVNCAALSPSLIESELFGHEKGAFTGALHQKIGRFEAAKDGTLFLDEVSEIPKEVQVKLLRVLQERQIERVGSHETINITCRLISASNKNLLEAIQKGQFREDLYYRLNVIDLHLTPLREKPEDIEILSRHFFDHFCRENHRESLEVSASVYNCLRHYDWPGNVRELKNVIERLVVMAKNKEVTLNSLPKNVRSYGQEKDFITLPYGMSLQEATQKILMETIRYHKGNKSKAATSLGIGRKTLHRKLEALHAKSVDKNTNA